MLFEWLACVERYPCPFTQFELIDVEEVGELTPLVRSYILDLLRFARFERGFLQAMAEELGWSSVVELIVVEQVPTSIAIKRGDFGSEIGIYPQRGCSGSGTGDGYRL